MKPNWLLILILSFVIGFVIKSYLVVDQPSTADEISPKPLKQSEITTTVLFGQAEQAVQIFDQQDQRIRILYFGFTRCPDVCPTSLAMLSGALNEVTDEQKSRLRPMFISLDPERDAADASHQYAQYFHTMIEGLSAPLAVTSNLASHYGVVFKKTQLDDSELGYTLDHNSYFYFLQPDGELITKVPHTSSTDPLVAAINSLTNISLTESQNTTQIKGTE